MGDLTEAAAKLRQEVDERVMPSFRRGDLFPAVAALLEAIEPHVAELESLGLTPVPGHKPGGYIAAALAVAAVVIPYTKEEQ